jgi:hypothetical protein
MAGLTFTPAAPAQVGGQDPREEIKEIFKRIEKEMQEIDRLLLEAARDQRTTASAPSDAKSSGKSAAKSAHEKQKDVSDSIQKIIDLIPPSQSQGQQGSNHGLSKPGENQGQGQGQQPPEGQRDGQGKRPGDKPQGQSDEQTAQGAGQAPTEPPGVKPQGGTPDGNQRSNETPRQTKGAPRDYDTEHAQRGKENVERWGDLPEHTRKVFENTNTDDLPVRYRKWIQDFYTRVQKTGNVK